MNEDWCNNIYSLLGGTCIGILLIISEILPFIKHVKSNGLLELIANNITVNKKIIDEEHIVSFRYEDDQDDQDNEDDEDKDFKKYKYIINDILVNPYI